MANDAFTAMVGAGTGGILGTLGNIWAQRRQWGQDKYMLEEGPSMYMAGMEKAGLNPLLMSSGGGMPPSALNPSQSTPKVSDPMTAAMMGVQAAKTVAETQRTKAETDLITSKKGGQDLTNAAQTAVNAANARNWTFEIAGKTFSVTGYTAEIAKKLKSLQLQALEFVKKDIYSTYIEAAYDYITKNARDNPEIMKLKAMAIALEMISKENKHWGALKIGGALGGATSGMGAAAIKGMTGGN